MLKNANNTIKITDTIAVKNIASFIVSNLYKQYFLDIPMQSVKITFLGTGSAIPTKERNHSSILVSFANENIIIDCGEGTQRQLRKANISPTKITKILLTHWHGDHILGIPALLQTLGMLNYSGTLKIYGPKGTKHFMKIIENLLRYINIKLEIHEVSGKFINQKDFFIDAAPMLHGIPANAYSIVFKDKVRLDRNKIKKLKLPNSPLLGKLQAGKDIMYNSKKIKSSQVAYLEKGKKITFVLDTLMNNNAIKLAKNSDILITESTFLSKDAARAKEDLHLTASQAATIAKKSKSKKLILTHFSQRYGNNLKPFEVEAKKIFKNVKIVKDLDSVTI